MARPLLCVTVTAGTTGELRRRRDQVRDADMIELRLDTVADPDVAGALGDRRRPVIVTCRPAWEGGHFAGSEEERCRLLGQALALGAEFVDIEWKANFQRLIEGTGGRRVIVSSHDFQSVPSDLAERAAAMRSTGAEVVKIAAKVNRLSDCAALLQFAAVNAKAGGASTVLVGMGDRGLVTRALPQRFASRWTYAGALSDIGQIDAVSLLDDYGFRRQSESTALYGLVGSPIAHSVSPAMHNAAFRAIGRDAVYLPLPAVDADDFMTFARAFGVRGASVTIPFKVPLYERVHEVDAVAREIGAVNTIHALDDRWIGTNTDAKGFLKPLQDRAISLKGVRTSILGAGGSARAVAVALGHAGAAVTVHARNAGRGAEVAAVADGRIGPWPPEPESWDVLVNCTPIGMHPDVDATPVPKASLTGGVVYDLVYNPPATRLLREAAAAGCLTLGGLDMLVAQAEEQFELWTGVRPPAGVMRQAALKRLAEFVTDANHVI